MARDEPPRPLDPQQALLALRAVYVIASYPFDDGLAESVQDYGSSR
jgi:hypothetical protein